jgi:hypothetical protein
MDESYLGVCIEMFAVLGLMSNYFSYTFFIVYFSFWPASFSRIRVINFWDEGTQSEGINISPIGQ